MKTRSLIIISCLVMSLKAYSEDAFVTTITGKTYFGELVSAIDSLTIAISVDGVMKYIKKEDILTIEKEEGGIFYNNREKIVEENNHPTPLYRQGAKVYVPFSSNKVAARCGAREVRLYLMNWQLWEVVAYPEAADFILHFVYNNDSDKACLVLVDREDNEICRTKWVSCDGWIPSKFGAEAGEKLVRKILPKLLKQYFGYFLRIC